MNQGRVRYTVNDVNANRYYQMPKFLFEGEFKGMSNDGRVLYSLLKDRHELSLKNGWINCRGEVYLIYAREEMAEMLGCSLPTARKAVKKLIEMGLIEEERGGFNKPNLIYLNAVIIDNTGEKKPFTPDGKEFSVQSEKSFQSGVKESFSLDGKNFTPNETYINITDYIDTNSINQSFTSEGAIESGNGSTNKIYEEGLLKNNIRTKEENIVNNNENRISEVFYSILEQAQLQYCTDPRAAEQALRLLYFCDKPMIINNISIPAQQLRRDLFRITIDDINNAFETFFDQAKFQEIKNPIAYLSRCIYNAIWDSGLRERAIIKYHGLEPMPSALDLDRYNLKEEEVLKSRGKCSSNMEKYNINSKLT